MPGTFGAPGEVFGAVGGTFGNLAGEEPIDPRDITVSLGQPRSAWSVGQPRGAWRVGAPTT